jgi:acyl-CoA thioesterase II
MMMMMMSPIKTTLSILLKWPNSRIFNRWFSSKKYILHETIRVHPTAQEDVFIQPTEDLSILPTRTTLFGGTMIGTAINAAQQTISQNQSVHSVHSYYIFAADALSPIFYHVTRIRDGKSFTTRSVVAKQNERVVFQCSMSFHQHEKGNLMHQTSLEQTSEVH